MLEPAGECVGAAVAIERDRFRPQLATAAPGPVLLDLRRATRIDHLGIRLVIGLLRECQRAQRPFQVAVASPFIASIFQAMRIDRQVAVIRVDAP